MTNSIKITWNGHSCFTLECGGYEAVIDPYDASGMPGYKPLELSADAVYASHGHADHGFKEAVKLRRTSLRSPFTVNTLECFHDDAGGTLRGKNLIHIFDACGMRCVHLGDLGHQLNADQLAALGRVDLLMIPVGGYYTIDAKGAKALVEAVRPRVTVPMHYRFDGIGYDVIGELGEFLTLCDGMNIVKYPSESAVLFADTPSQIMVLKYRV